MNTDSQKKSHHLQESKMPAPPEPKREKRSYSTFDNILEGIQILGFDWRYLYLNSSAEKHNRRPNQELLGRNYAEMWPGIEDTHVFSMIKRCLEERLPSQLENRFTYPNGAVGWFDLRIEPIPDGVFIMSFDITERVLAEMHFKQMKRLYATLSQINQTVVRVRERETLFQAICDVAVQYGEFALAWVGLLDEDGKVHPVVADGLDVKNWPFDIVDIHKGGLENGLIAQAVLNSRVMTSEDLSSDQRLSGLKDQFEMYGYHSSAAVPIRFAGETIGVVSLVSREVDLFKSEDEVRLLDEMGLDISFALDLIDIEDKRKQAEDALRMSESRYRELVQNANSAIIHYDRNGTILFFNEYAQSFFGYSAEEIIGQSVNILLPKTESTGEDLTKLVEQIVAHPEKFVDNVNENVCRDDRRVWMAWTNTPIRNDKGKVIAILTVGNDITRQRQAEKALEESHQNLQILFDTMTEAVALNEIICDENGDVVDYRILNVNHAFYSATNLTAEQAIGNVASKLYGLSAEFNRSFWREHRDTEKTIYSEMVSPITHRWFLVTTSPIVDNKFVTVFLDITERKQAEDSLRASEERFRSLYENATLGMYRTTPEGEIQLANPALVKMLGYSSYKDLAQRNLEQEGYNPAYERSKFRQEIEKSGAVSGIESAWTRKDGRTIFVRESARVARDETGKAIYYEGTVEDITQRKQAEQKLQESERKLKLFVEYAPAAVAMFDRDMRYIAFSRRFISDYRLPNQDITGRSHYDVFPEISEGWKEIHQRCLAGAIEKADDDPFPRADGSLDWVRWEIRPWYENGEIGGIILFSEVITERKKAEMAVQQRTEDLLLLNELNQAVNRGEDIAAIVETFMREVRKLFACKDVSVYLLGESGKYLEMQNSTISQNLTDKIEKMIGVTIPRIRIPIKEGSFTQQLLDKSQGEIINDPQALQRWMHEFVETTFLPDFLRAPIKKLIPEIYEALNIRSGISIPLVSSKRTVGLLDMSSDGQFVEEDLARIRNISHQMTTVILRKQAEQQVQLQLQRVRALSEIDRAIASSLDMRLSLEILLTKVQTQLGVDAASVLLLNPSNQTLEYVIGKGFRALAAQKSSLRIGEGLAGQVGIERKVLHVPDLVNFGPKFKRADLFKEEGFVEYFGIPLVAKGLLKGVLEIFNRTAMTTDLEWVNYLETLGGQAAIAIDNAQLFEGMQQSNLELSMAYDATIAGWSHAMDLRDKETEGHSKRVTDLTLRLAEEMGISRQDQVHIYRGALLHDIGKLGVPDQILLKSAKLTDEEWEIMRQHPVYAYKMLMPISYLRPALDIPYCHHEKWDGSGYPSGLKGEQIPLAARLFAVVDVWDALRTDRPYRAALSSEEALKYIREQAGRHFDPAIVKVFLRVIGDIESAGSQGG